MAITSTDKLVTKEVLERFKDKVDAKYIDTAELESATEDFITEEALEDYAKTEDVLTKDGFEEDLKDYAKTSDVESGYVKKENGKGLSTNDFDANAKAITDKADTTYATKTELGAKLDSETAESTYAKKSDVASAVRWKGAVATQAQLPNSGQELGDMYDVQDTGMNYVWNGTGWDAFAPNIDISGKADKTDFVAMTTAEVDAWFTA